MRQMCQTEVRSVQIVCDLRSFALLVMCFVAGIGSTISVAQGAEFSAREVTTKVFRSTAESPVDLSQRDLSFLDLASLDFRHSRLAGTDLYGTDLSHANFVGVDLSGARLDRAKIVRANFSGADLSNASLLRPSTVSLLNINLLDAARFMGAKLVGTRILARLQGANFRRADLTDANLGPFDEQGGQVANLPFCQLYSADFSTSVLRRANLRYANLVFAKFVDADLREADFTGADLSEADLSGANVTGAIFTNANLKGAKLVGVKGLSETRGMASPSAGAQSNSVGTPTE